MRIASYLSVALLALTVMTASAHAEEARIFGTTTCAQTFSCASTNSSEISSMASSCSMQGLGISSNQQGIFDNSSLDGNNCITGQIPTSGNTRPSAAQCCVIPDGDNCKMRCQLLVY